MTSRSSARPRLRPLRWLVGLLTLVLAGAGVVLAWYTLNPRTNPAGHVDALVVLATQPGAHAEATRLAEDGVTDLLLVSAPPEHEFSLCHAQDVPAEIVCFTPEPTTTQGEAIVGTQLAREHGAQSLGVLTFDHHIERSRVHFRRCWDQDLHLYEFTPRRGIRGKAYDFVYAMAAYGKALAVPGCQTEPPAWMQDPIEWIKRVR